MRSTGLLPLTGPELLLFGQKTLLELIPRLESTFALEVSSEPLKPRSPDISVLRLFHTPEDSVVVASGRARPKMLGQPADYIVEIRIWHQALPRIRSIPYTSGLDWGACDAQKREPLQVDRPPPRIPISIGSYGQRTVTV